MKPPHALEASRAYGRLETDYMLVTGFSYDATIEKIETWADSQANLA